MDDLEDELELIEFLDEFADDVPVQFFEREPTKETTTVRTMNFVLRSVVDQLRKPLSVEAESVIKWLIYKQAGPHRHQKFFGFFRQLHRLVRKYNEMTLVKKLNSVLKKAENCPDAAYKLEKSAIRFMGAAFLKRVYLLEKIQKTCLKCADGAMGLLELDQWTNLSLVVVSLCAQLHSDVITQCLDMEKAYKPGVSVFRTVDGRFPPHFCDLKVVQKLKTSSGMFDDRKVDLSAVSRLLKYSEHKMEEAQSENDFIKKRNEVLNDLLTTELDLTPQKSSTTIFEKKSIEISVEKAKVDMSDLGISISRDELSFLSNSGGEKIKGEEEEEDVLFSPNLFKKSAKISQISKVSKKKKKSKKSK